MNALSCAQLKLVYASSFIGMRKMEKTVNV